MVIVFLSATFYAVHAIDQAGIDAELARANAAIAALAAEPPLPDAALAGRLAGEFLLRDAHVADAATMQPDEISVALPGAGQAVIAWTPHRFGSETFVSVAPMRLLATTVLLLILGFILWRLYSLASLLEAQRGEARALAQRDALTGLPNRLAFDERLKSLCADRPAKPLALFYLDLDDFKPVNDTMGHAAGDQVLCQVGQRLMALAQPGDLVARLGGDEFAIIRQTRLSEAELAAFADIIHASLTRPMAVLEWSIDVGVSMGIALLPDHGTDADRLLQVADAALYRAKKQPDIVFVLADPIPVLHAAA